MGLIVHRSIHQPASGRRLLEHRRSHEVLHDSERRIMQKRRTITDRRKPIS